MFSKKSFLVLLLCCTQLYSTPRVVINFVIDQWAAHVLQKIQPHLKGGIPFLLKNGVSFTNAHYPHAATFTAVGHTALNTGTFAWYHGVIGNFWYNEKNKRVKCDDDFSGNAQVFSPTGVYDNGKSSHYMVVDGISDQCMMLSNPAQTFNVWSLSCKSRAAIMPAGKLGKAVWLDTKSGFFTSSKAYFYKFPEWIKNFNKKKKINEKKQFVWKPLYKKEAYNFPFVNNYQYTMWKKGLMGEVILIDTSKRRPFNILQKLPHSNEFLIDLVQDCFTQNYNESKNATLVLWISFSSLDKIAHIVGPDSKESIDTIYRISKNIDDFIKFVYKRVPPQDVFISLTADHGGLPIPELVKAKGLPFAKRINARELITSINQIIEQKLGVANVFKQYSAPQLYVDYKIWNTLDIERQNLILKKTVAYLKTVSGIQNAWTNEQLDVLPVTPLSLEDYFKKQRHHNMGGQVIVQVQPYNYITTYPTGTSHESPYNYDTHVPLVIYQKGMYENKQITDKVWITQFANTLAQVLNVPQPSASNFEVLPGLFGGCKCKR